MIEGVPGQRWSVLLALLLLAILLEPALGPSFGVELISLALFEVVIVGALVTSTTNPKVRAMSGVIAVSWFGASLLAVADYNLNGIVALFSAAMLLCALLATFRNLFDRDEGDLESLVGAVFGYVLLAMAWAVLYVQIERWQPGSYVYYEDWPLWSAMIYYSIVTVTSLGYGDILPTTPLAGILASLQAVVGVLYIAIMIGSIVGTFHSNRE